MKTMDAADYLEARGWNPHPQERGRLWLDPIPGDDVNWPTAAAVRIQQSRDAAAERAAWVATAAALASMVGYDGDGTPTAMHAASAAAFGADAMVAAYRKRFAVNVRAD